MTKPTLYLLPGFHGSPGLFGPLLAELQESINALALGFTSQDTIEEHADEASKELPQAGALLLAESFSSLIALKLAAREPDRFRGLILSTPFASTPFPMLAKLGAMLPRFCFERSPIRKFVLDTFCLNTVADSHLKTTVLEAIDNVPASTVKRRIQVLARTDLSSELERIQTPCLLIEASADRVVNRDRIDKLQQQLPNSQRARVRGPHLILQANPQAAAVAIKRFVNSI